MKLVIALITAAFLSSCTSTTRKEVAPPNSTPVQAGFADVNDLKMYYEVHGAPRKGMVPIVVLHGGGSTIETLSKLIPVLASHRQVITFEQQGNGRTSDVKDRPFSFAQSAKDTVALMRLLKVEKADVLGFSNGGHIAVQLAVDHPEVLNKVIIMSAMTSREGAPQGFWSGFKEPKIEMLPPVLKEQFLRVNPNEEALKNMFVKSFNRMAAFKGWPTKTIKAIKTPSLILFGDHDVVTPEHGAWLAKTIPNAKLMILPDTDHATILDRPGWYEAAVEHFLTH